MPRREFSKSTKREALKRSDKRCEATGTEYGLKPGERCNADLSYGVEFDHGLADGLGGDNSLDNCVCVCRKCHRFKTGKDVYRMAKADRVRDRDSGIRRGSGSAFQNNRNGRFKSKVGGGTVLRATGEPVGGRR